MLVRKAGSSNNAQKFAVKAHVFGYCCRFSSPGAGLDQNSVMSSEALEGEEAGDEGRATGHLIPSRRNLGNWSEHFVFGYLLELVPELVEHPNKEVNVLNSVIAAPKFFIF